jgi:hypothetical protein
MTCTKNKETLRGRGLAPLQILTICRNRKCFFIVYKWKNFFGTDASDYSSSDESNHISPARIQQAGKVFLLPSNEYQMLCSDMECCIRFIHFCGLHIFRIPGIVQIHCRGSRASFINPVSVIRLCCLSVYTMIPLIAYTFLLFFLHFLNVLIFHSLPAEVL